MSLVFQMDLGFYYLGVASQPFKLGTKALMEPVFSTRPSVPFYYFMRFYNRRFAQIARARRARNVWGCGNNARRFLIPGFTFSGSSAKPILKAMIGWFFLELREGWRSWFVSRAKREPEIQAAPAVLPFAE
jgi:hypothetical protein